MAAMVLSVATRSAAARPSAALVRAAMRPHCAVVAVIVVFSIAIIAISSGAKKSYFILNGDGIVDDPPMRLVDDLLCESPQVAHAKKALETLKTKVPRCVVANRPRAMWTDKRCQRRAKRRKRRRKDNWLLVS